MTRIITIIILLAVIIRVIHSLFIMFSAKDSAIQIASNEPFCIQVSARGDYNNYKEIKSIFDLLDLNMRDGTEDFYMYGERGNTINHAVLVVGTISNYRLYRWSYQDNKFIEGAYGPHGKPPIYCTPQLNFFERQNTKTKEIEKNINFVFHDDMLHDYMFSIPRAYSPRIILSYDAPGIFITARAPTFIPTNGVNCNGRLCNMVEINFSLSDRRKIWREVANDQIDIENLGEYFGLTKQRVLYKRDIDSSIRYFKLDENGKVKTLIRCFEEDNIQYQHSFYKNGILFGFSEMPSDIPSWETTENTLADLFNSFKKPVQ